MCGIAGYDMRDRAAPAALAERLIAAIKHRGPDGDGVQRFARRSGAVYPSSDPTAPIALLHARLAIIDLSAAGAEPMPSEDRRVWLTLNGEIYNFGELRTELERHGHRFRSRADAEVVIHGYEQWGDRVVERLRGMFAFALYDAERDRWLCARDPFGIKPFVYSYRPGQFAFASDLNALRLVPGVDLELDRDALAQYLALGYVPAPLTIVRGARKLERGQRLIVDAQGASLQPFAAPTAGEAISDPRTAVEAALAAVAESVTAHLVADVPVGGFLSGGIDSSLVCALASRSGARPTCFTIGFAEPEFDESQHARRIAGFLDLPWRSMRMTADETRAALVDLPQIFDEPFADPSAAPTALVARLARQQVKAVLSGDGGDELFLGYTRYRLFALADIARRSPRPLRALAAAVARRLPARAVDDWYRRGHRLTGLPPLAHPSRKLLAVTHSLALDDRLALYADTLRVTGPAVLPALVACSDEVALAALRRAAATAPEPVPQLFGSLVDEATYLPEDILTKVDRTTMAVALEARVPLLDRSVRAVARAIAPALHGRGGGKAILRAALDRLVPPALTRRPKQGFSIPLAAWLRGPLRETVRACATDPALGDSGIELDQVRRLFDEHQSGAVDHSP
ncbi:MAG: asparagine synthase (glutamine-hydrolyzing), partial [Deltaproteobacteria bacterium]|nr:asparagine synthase (glutamine-hydrolyzing) [Deltaproteobacteria bacterium]